MDLDDTKKDHLVAETTREVALLRETELRFYIDHIGGMQTMSTLLAGFAFTALVQDLPAMDLDDTSVGFYYATGAYRSARNLTTGEMYGPVYRPFGSLQAYTQ